jgi:hypothetical protein
VSAHRKIDTVYWDIKTHEGLVHPSSDAHEQRQELAYGLRGTRGRGREKYHRWESPSVHRKRQYIHLRYSHFAAVAEIEVGTIEALVTNTDDRSHLATIARNGAVDDLAGTWRTTASIERVHWDRVSRGDWLGDDLGRMIERITVNCVLRMLLCTFAALGDRRAGISNLENETGEGCSRGYCRS